MSEIGRPENYPFTITLVRVISETWEDYIERCQDIASYVSSKHPKLPDEMRIVNLDNFTQVSETAYQVETPGYAPQEEAGNERDTHFAGFATLLLSEIQSEYGGFVDVTPAMTQLETLIAQRAYDLVWHALYYNGIDASYRPGKDYRPTVFYEREVTEHTNEIPDLTE